MSPAGVSIRYSISATSFRRLINIYLGHVVFPQDIDMFVSNIPPYLLCTSLTNTFMPQVSLFHHLCLRSLCVGSKVFISTPSLLYYYYRSVLKQKYLQGASFLSNIGNTCSTIFSRHLVFVAVVLLNSLLKVRVH